MGVELRLANFESQAVWILNNSTTVNLGGHIK